jgi:hypothetical protein
MSTCSAGFAFGASGSISFVACSSNPLEYKLVKNKQQMNKPCDLQSMFATTSSSTVVFDGRIVREHCRADVHRPMGPSNCTSRLQKWFYYLFNLFTHLSACDESSERDGRRRTSPMDQIVV